MDDRRGASPAASSGFANGFRVRMMINGRDASGLGTGNASHEGYTAGCGEIAEKSPLESEVTSK